MSDISHIMQDDTLASQLAKDHDYVGSLLGESSSQFPDFQEPVGDGLLNGISRFIASVPWEVWAIIGILLLAWMVMKFYKHYDWNSGKKTDEPEESEADNIYEIDFDAEMSAALSRGDYSALVRLVYLRTLRTLADGGRIEWKLSKTPEQYSLELPTTEFRRMTWHFLRVRYGRFVADRAVYEEMATLREEVEKGGGE